MMSLKKIIVLLAFFVTLVTSLFPENIYIIVCLSVLIWFILPFKRWWDANTYALLLFSVFYTIMVVLGGNMKSGFLTLSYFIAPVAFYRLGRYVMDQIKEENRRVRFVLFVVIAYLIVVFSMTIINISMVGLINNDRTLIGFNTDNEALAATLYGLMTSWGIGCLGACLEKNIKILVRLLFVVVVLFSMLTVIHLINRGGLVIFVVCLLFSIFNISITDFKRLIPIAVLLIVSIFIYFQYDLNSSDVISAYERRNTYSGYGLSTAGGRTELWVESFTNMISHPLGWSQERYAHNLWLDMARIGGWCSLIPFLIVTFRVAKHGFYLFHKKCSGFSLLMLSLNIALFLAAFIEPVIEGSILFFYLLLFVWGMTETIYRETKMNFVRNI